MSRFVVCPATLLFILEDGRPVPERHHVVGPASLRSHVLDLLLRQVNSAQLTEAQAMEYHERLTTMKLRLLNDRVSRRVAWDIARSKGWESVRDAEYLAIGKLQADALVTIDEHLADAAAGIVPVFPLDHLWRSAD
ncbi:MAG: hypothetical protein KDB60_11865 [Propionibacteriaceae bacterium]|nr:hypothetical protein [Propionibacteriaceae bacterium]